VALQQGSRVSWPRDVHGDTMQHNPRRSRPWPVRPPGNAPTMAQRMNADCSCRMRRRPIGCNPLPQPNGTFCEHEKPQQPRRTFSSSRCPGRWSLVDAAASPPRTSTARESPAYLQGGGDRGTHAAEGRCPGRARQLEVNHRWVGCSCRRRAVGTNATRQQPAGCRSSGAAPGPQDLCEPSTGHGRQPAAP
jgi:hypothetical protein